MKSIKKLLVVTIVAILLCSMAVATVSATSDVKDEKKDTGISIESKEKKVSSYKVTWDYNGGKIGNKKSKVTTVKRGSKIGKFVATPKKSGYSFKGWYTKKNGGKKISKNTKVTKKVTFFAQWSKKSSSRVLNAEEKKLVGAWVENFWGVTRAIAFRNDGTWAYSQTGSIGYGQKSEVRWSGNYQAKNGNLYLTNVVSGSKTGYRTPLIFTKNDVGTKRSDEKGTYKFCTDSDHGNCLILSNVAYFSDSHVTRAGTGEYSYLIQPF